MELDRIRITVIGRGRMGGALSASLRAALLEVDGPLGRGATGAGSELVILCVPDREIAAAARLVEPGRLVAHCSGATSLAPLAPHESLSIHPLMTVTGVNADFAGAGCAVAGSSPRALSVAEAIARRLGMHPVAVADEDRDLYHAAASMASNYLVTLEDAAERLFGLVGVERAHMVPLVRAAVQGWSSTGAELALTGPIARGDEGTVERQRAAVVRRAPELVALWDALAEATRAVARRGGAAGGVAR